LVNKQADLNYFQKRANTTTILNRGKFVKPKLSLTDNLFNRMFGNGKIDIIPSGYVKEGEAFLMPDTGVLRIGATDLTFNIPGQNGKDDERFFFPMANYAGFELRAFSHQAFAIKHPAKCVKLTNIVNS
jgi:hypothetical protein